MSVTAERIAAAAARAHDLSVPEMFSDGRSRSRVRARRTAWWLARRLTRRSLAEIARDFGGVNHTTVLYGLRRLEELERDDPREGERLRDLAADVLLGAEAETAISDMDALRVDVAALRRDIAAFRAEYEQERAEARARVDRLELAPVSARNDARDRAMIAAHRRREASRRRETGPGR